MMTDYKNNLLSSPSNKPSYQIGPQGVIYLVRTHEGGRGSSKCVRMRTRGERVDT